MINPISSSLHEFFILSIMRRPIPTPPVVAVFSRRLPLLLLVLLLLVVVAGVVVATTSTTILAVVVLTALPISIIPSTKNNVVYAKETMEIITTGIKYDKNNIPHQDICSSLTEEENTASSCLEFQQHDTNDDNNNIDDDPGNDEEEETNNEDDDEDDEENDDEDDDEDDEEEFVFECMDDHVDCPTYAQSGACIDNAGYMTYHCAVSCQTCDVVREGQLFTAQFVKESTNSQPCMDDHYQCLEWASMGECENNPGYMKKSCRRSCVICFDGSNQFGIGQNLPNINDTERMKTEILLEKSIQYMKTVWSDSKFDNVRHKCRNMHEDCSYWAALGECDANPKYMQVNCAPACFTCDLLDIRHRCPIEPGNECIWKPGDLNILFENIVDDADGSGAYKRYNPIAYSRPKYKRDGSVAVPGVEKEDGPWVISLENFVSAEEADRLVEIGKKRGYKRSADVGKEKPDGTHDAKVSDSRTSHNTWCQEEDCYADPLVAPVIERIANITGTHPRNSEYLQLLQYEPGQYYKQHHDYIPHHKDMPCGVRMLTLFIYLSDVEEGGGTKFPLLDITIEPKKGNAALWPSVLDEDPESKDGRTDHEALPVLRGLKYGANAWIHSRDFKAAFEKNCH